MITTISNNTDKEFYTICSTCGSELSYYYDDVKMEEVPYNYMPNRTIKCPVCNKETFAELKTKDTYMFNPSGQFRIPFPDNAVFNGGSEVK